MLSRRHSFTRAHRSSITCPSTSVFKRRIREGDMMSVSFTLFLSCLLILSRSLAEQRPHRPPRAPPCPSQVRQRPIGSLSPPLPRYSGAFLYASTLRGLLAADLVGFQAASYTCHFRQTVSCILALKALPMGIQIEGTFGSGTRAHKRLFVDIGVFLWVRCRTRSGFDFMDPHWRL
jgi:hypothetical protein